MTALEFQASLSPDGTVRVPSEVAEQLKNVAEFRVLLLLPSETETAEEEDEAWDRLTESEFFRGYAESDSIYDDIQPGHDRAT
jgi:hypothetical protein